MMSDDLSKLIQSWPYDPDQTMRIIIADDGRAVLQVRLPLGIEQYEIDGRPDGKQPLGFTSFVDAIEDRLRKHIVETGSDLGFFIGADDGAQLQAEGALYYYRYLILFQMQYYPKVVRDCDHNLHLCDLLERFCEDEETRNGVLQFRPYIIRMRAAAEALGIESGESDGDFRKILEDAVEAIHNLEEIDTPAFQFERIRSINYLKSMVKRMDVSESLPTTDLEIALQKAIEDEDYETAAILRDRISGIDAGIDSAEKPVDKEY